MSSQAAEASSERFRNLVDKDLYAAVQQAPRVLINEFTLPIRSGRAWEAAAGSIVKINTPSGPQVERKSISGGAQYDFHCHSNLVRAVTPWGLNETDVHHVINIFQSTGLDDGGRYFMNPCPAEKGDSLEFLASQDLLMALSTCPGGDLSLWGFGSDSEEEMIKCCRPLKVQVYEL
ncbi:unnamed protein product [Clonostachys solani]|uniref:DUF1989 domain-containing protein n=1 Tax=Clonostachys solani TaxID=160281 RepID=A0A9N9YYN0_9HYPO|nr:unnamed protein product [Clonostachys solani]